jgi:hypothetical protein
MTIFALFVYGCLTSNGFDGLLLSKTCGWNARDQYAAAERCETDGAMLVGTQIFGDMYPNRKVEAYKCLPVSLK